MIAQAEFGGVQVTRAGPRRGAFASPRDYPEGLLHFCFMIYFLILFMDLLIFSGAQKNPVAPSPGQACRRGAGAV
jgi:hypothetical protein